MKFYFCEKCGKRLMEYDVEVGDARNKKLAGVYCTDCAVGIVTLETMPLTETGAREILQSENSRTKPLPSQGRPMRRSSGIHLARNSNPKGHATPERTHAKNSNSKSSKAPLLAGLVVFTILGSALIWVTRTSPDLTLPSGRRATPPTVSPPLPDRPISAAPVIDPAQKPMEPVVVETPPADSPQNSVDPDEAAFDRLIALPGVAPREREKRMASAEAFLKVHPDSIFAARVRALMDQWSVMPTQEEVVHSPVEAKIEANRTPPSVSATPHSPSVELKPESPPRADMAPGKLPFVALSAAVTGIPSNILGDPVHALVDVWRNPEQKVYEVFGVVALEKNGNIHLKTILHSRKNFQFEVVAPPSPKWALGLYEPHWWDLNGDGKLEAFCSKTGRTFIRDRESNWIPQGPPVHGSWIDFDGDGFLEELCQVGSRASGRVKIVTPKLRSWTNAPPEQLQLTGQWSAADIIKSPATAAGASFSNAFSVDLNGDHINELILHATTGKKDYISFTRILFLANPAAGAQGWFDRTIASGLPAESGLYFPEDIDADGDLDLVDWLGGPTYLNDGLGRFSASEHRMVHTDKRIASRASREKGYPAIETVPLLVDLDNNGFRDVVCSRGRYDWMYGTFMNRGSGKFEEVEPLTINRHGTVYCDLDGDGDLDAIQASKTTITVHQNTTPLHGLHVIVRPRSAITAFMGAKLWVYVPADTDERPQPTLIHYRQGFSGYDLNARQHVGIGDAKIVDVKVRFPSGVERWERGVHGGTEVEIRE